jgi:hypothetical protein
MLYSHIYIYKFSCYLVNINHMETYCYIHKARLALLSLYIVSSNCEKEQVIIAMEDLHESILQYPLLPKVASLLTAVSLSVTLISQYKCSYLCRLLCTFHEVFFKRFHPEISAGFRPVSIKKG